MISKITSSIHERSFGEICGQFSFRVLILCLIALTIFSPAGLAAQKKVAIIADGHTTFVMTDKDTPEEVLKEAGISFKAGDEIRMSTRKVFNRTLISVYRPVPIILKIGNHRLHFLTAQPTVGEFLAKEGYKRSEYRFITPEKTAIKKDMVIAIVSLNPSEKLAFAEEEKKAALEIKQREEAKKAERLARSRERERLLATGEYVDTPEGLKHFVDYRIMEATAYLPTDGNGDCITATGIRATYGVVAVDPDVIPLGTRLYIPGYGVALAADTGGAIIGNIIDLCMESYNEAIQFGRRNVEVYLLADGD